MQTLLCAINSQFIHSAPSVYMLKTAVHSYGRTFALSPGELSIVEYTMNQPYETIYYDIVKRRPDILAFSVYIWNLPRIRRLCHELKQIRPAVTILLGGPEVSYGISHTGIPDSDYDCIIEGEGERAFFTWLIRRNCPGWQPPASWEYRQEGKCVRASLIPSLDELPCIYTEETLPLFQNRILYYEASRGCPFHCAYCLSASAGPVRLLSLERVFQDLEFLIAHGIPQVKFVDRTFNCQPERARQIIAYIIDHAGNKAMNFHFEVGGDLFTPSLIQELRRAPKGLFQLEIGIQSTYEPALRASVRKAPFDKIARNTMELLRSQNVHIHVDLIAGLPYESLEQFRKSYDDVYRLHAHQLQLGFLKLLSGAPLETSIQEHDYRFSEEPPYEILCNRYIAPEDLLELKKIEDVTERYYNSGRFTMTLQKLEGEWSSPYSMMQHISQAFDRHGFHFLPLHSNVLYDILWEICQQLPEAATYRYLLLYDFFAASPSDRLPKSLSCFEIDHCQRRSRSLDILKQFPPARGQWKVRLTPNGWYIFDYSKPDPVTGRYPEIASNHKKLLT